MAASGALLYGSQTAPVIASDHDDGETQIKSRNLNLTDLYVFREDWHSGVAADAANMILVMNTNPRSLPRQQYFFNTEATYSIHIDRQSSADNAVTGGDDVRLDFRFAAPDASGQQSFALDIVNLDASGAPTSQTTSSGVTTPAAPLIGNPNPTPVNNTITVDGETLTVFAGLREDPFFFDVEQFFRVRAGLAGGGPAEGFFSEEESTDFAAGYNVNSIIVRAPISFLQADGETTFDVWESITLPNDLAARQ